LQLFQFVNVEPVDQQAQPEEVPTRIVVAEGRHQRVRFGAGYGTEEEVRVEGEYHHVNFLGGARSAGVHARWSSLDRGVRLDFEQPYLFSPRFSLRAEAQQWYAFTPAYQSQALGGRVVVTHGAGERTSWDVSLTSERDSSVIDEAVRDDPSLRNDLIALGLNPDTGEQRGTRNAVGFDFQRSTADAALDSHHGYRVAAHVENAGKLVPGTFEYWSVSLDGRHYLSLGDRLVLASRAQAGEIVAPAG